MVTDTVGRLKANGLKALILTVSVVVLGWLWFTGWLDALWRPLISAAEMIRADLPNYGPFAPLAYIALYAGQIVIAPIPGAGLSVVGGFLFGTFLSVVYSLIGIWLGGGAGFVVGRRMGWPLIERLAPHSWLQHWRNLATVNSSFTWFLLMLAPTIDAVYFIAGLTTLSLQRFLLLIALGRAPGLIVSSFLGAHSATFGPEWWLGLVAMLIVLAWLGHWLRDKLERRVAQA
jgi:uncharacterized membrane protein YdjX (TVP38/TMEM64 family)